MKKPIKTLIAGIAAFTILSTPLYVNGSTKEDVSEFKNIFTSLYDQGKYNRGLKDKDYDYEIYISVSGDLELEVIDNSVYRKYKIIDEKSDGILDFYVGSKGYGFKFETTDIERWQKLQYNYSKFIRKLLPIAKKVLNERNSSLDKDLEDME